MRSINASIVNFVLGSVFIIAIPQMASAKPVYFSLNTIFDFGGKSVYDGNYKGKSTQLTAGEGVALGGGLLYLPDDSDFGVEVGMDFKFNSAFDDTGKGTVIMYRTPITLTGAYVIDAHRFNLGVTYLDKLWYECDVQTTCDSLPKIKPTTGLLAQYVYSFPMGKIGFSGIIGLRANVVDYNLTGGGKSGNSIGVIIGWLM